jgi:hypothetical protein
MENPRFRISDELLGQLLTEAEMRLPCVTLACEVLRDLRDARSALRSAAVQQLDELGETDKRQLDEYAHLFACVLEHATGGRASKPYDKETCYRLIDEWTEQLCREAVEEAQHDEQAQEGTAVAQKPRAGTPEAENAVPVPSTAQTARIGRFPNGD